MLTMIELVNSPGAGCPTNSQGNFWVRAYHQDTPAIDCIACALLAHEFDGTEIENIRLLFPTIIAADGAEKRAV